MSRGFDRVLTEGDVLRRRASFLQRIHIDGWLLFLLLVLVTIGLFVLYSAGGKDQALLIKQAFIFWARFDRYGCCRAVRTKVYGQLVSAVVPDWSGFADRR